MLSLFVCNLLTPDPHPNFVYICLLSIGRPPINDLWLCYSCVGFYVNKQRA